MKADGLPTYHFANVVDDYLMKITTVIRGEEWLPSLPIHKLIYDAFGWKMPETVHLPLILNPSGKGKLSKRDALKNNYSIFPIKWEKQDGLKEKGLLASAQLAYISQLGSSFNTDEIELDINRMSKKFTLSSLQKGGARFDFEKAKSINQNVLSKIDSSLLISENPKVFDRLSCLSRDKALMVVDLIKKRVSLMTDFQKEITPFIESPAEFDGRAAEKVLRHINIGDLSIVEEHIRLTEINHLKENIYRVSKEKNVNFGKLMQFLRISLVGNLSGPDIFFIIKIIGKDVTLRRFNSLLNKTKKQ
jgi:glutamyl-tRNA synthetase